MKTNKFRWFNPKFTFLLALLAMPGFANSQDTGFYGLSQQELIVLSLFGALILLVILLLLVAFYVIKVVNLVMEDNMRRKREAQGLPPLPAAPSLWSKFMEQMTRRVPLEREEEVMLHHEYDGIRELDNHLPPWWKYLFYLTIAFSVVYVWVYHISGSLPLQAEEYEREMVAAAQKLESKKVDAEDGIDEFNVSFTNDSEALSKGAALYKMHCVVCHGAEGQGGIGPNLTDGYWIHGGDVKDIYKVIKYGVTEKGMIPWQSTLSPTQMRDLSSFIISLEGSNPPNPKAPEGQPYERVMEVEDEDADDTDEEEVESEEEGNL